MTAPSPMPRVAAAGLSIAALVAGAAWLIYAALEVDVAGPVSTPSTVGYPRVIEVGGVDVTIPARPTRVVPCSARAVDLICDLLTPERIAALPEQAIEYATLGDAEPRFESIPRFDAYLAEPVLAFRPDLVVADSWQAADTHARLRSAGVVVLVLPEMADWSDACRDLRTLGTALGVGERAAQLIDEGERAIERLRVRGANRPALRCVSYSNFGAQGFTAGAGTTLDEIMRLAGVVNQAAEEGRVGHGEMTYEDLLSMDPDVIIVSRPLVAPTGHSGDRGGASEQLLLHEDALSSLRAIRDRRIVAVPPGLFASASHRIVHGAEVLRDELDELIDQLNARSVEVAR